MAAVVVLLDVLCFWVVVSATDASFDPARRLRGAMVNSSQMQATAMAAEELERRTSEDNPCDYEDCTNGPILEYQCCFAGCGCSVSVGCGSSDLPDYCRSLGATPNVTEPEQAAADEPLLAGATAVYCNPTLTDPPQYCPGGVACPNCGSDSCACPTGPSPPSPTPPSTGCKQLSGTYCAGGGQECNCAYCDDFSKNDECANTCRVMNGYFSSPFREHPWAPVWLENPVNAADGTDCSWMKGHGDDCKKCDEYAMACRRANPPHIGATYSENSGGNCKAW